MNPHIVNPPWAVHALRTFDWTREGHDLPIPPQRNGLTLNITEENIGTHFMAIATYGPLAYITCRFTMKPEGWVPRTILNKGSRVVEIQDLPITLPKPPPANIQGLPLRPAQNVLHKTLQDLFVRIQAEQSRITSTIAGLSSVSMEIFFAPDAATYGDMVYSFFIPKVAKVFASGRFDPNDLIALNTDRSQWPKVPCIYLRLYKHKAEIGVYGGQANDLIHKDVWHSVDKTRNMRSIHYRFFRESEAYVMIPIMRIDGKHGPELNKLLDIAEFAIVCLFQSWVKLLFSPNPFFVGSYAVDYQAANVFRQLSSEVFAGTGWVGFETNGQPVPKAVHSVVGFENKQPIHVSVEVWSNKEMTNFQPHPFRWCRLPSVGRNQELEKLNSMAVKLEWVNKEGEWVYVWLQRDELWLAEQNHDVLGTYQRGLRMFQDITSTQYVDGPAWLPTLSRSPVQVLEYDHLKQCYRLEIWPRRNLPWPTDYSLAENAQRIMDILPDRVKPHTNIGPKPANFEQYGQPRKHCDLCFSLFEPVQCNPDPVTNACKNCTALRRPCTWTGHSAVSTGQDYEAEFQSGLMFEELGAQVCLVKHLGPSIQEMREAPFDPHLEGEDVTEVNAENE